jgi:hypothetical protein
MLRAGFARTDITPGRDLDLMGYEFRGERLPPGNEGVRDPLFARALVIDDGATRGVVVSLDLAVVSTPFARRLREAVAGAADTGAARVIVAATHTHSGPDLGRRVESKEDSDGAPSPATPVARYAALVEERAREAAARAAGLTFPVRLGVREAPLGLAYQRRVATPSGVRHAWNPQEYPDLDPAPAAENTCTVAVLAQTNGPRRFALLSIPAHGVVLGKTSRLVSADWPGAACSAVEALVPGARAMFLAGASGDSHPWIATQEDPAHVETVGRAAGSFVALLTHALKDCGEPALAWRSETVEIAGAELDVAAFRLGALTVAAWPGEVFGALSLEVRRRIGGALILATNANGWTGYWPTAEAFSEGRYEVESALRENRTAEDSGSLVEAVARAVSRLG